MDDLHELLSEFEQKLEQLQKEGGLAACAAQLFKEFSAEVERRTGRDRRESPTAQECRELRFDVKGLVQRQRVANFAKIEQHAFDGVSANLVLDHGNRGLRFMRLRGAVPARAHEPILFEYFDREGVTKRVGDSRQVL